MRSEKTTTYYKKPQLYKGDAVHSPLQIICAARYAQINDTKGINPCLNMQHFAQNNYRGCCPVCPKEISLTIFILKQKKTPHN